MKTSRIADEDSVSKEIKYIQNTYSTYHASDRLGACRPRNWPTLDILIRDLQDLICIGPYLAESYRKRIIFLLLNEVSHYTSCEMLHFSCKNVCNESIFIRYSRV